MFEAIERGEIKALWVMATNPAVSLPRAGAVRDALAKLDLFVVSENVLSNDTVNAGAHLLLPAAAWGEKDGTVTNSERRISRQRAVPAAAGRGAGRIGGWSRRSPSASASAMRSPIASAADVFREHAALSAFENDGTRDFDIGALARSRATRHSTRSRRCNGRRRVAARRRHALFRARRLLHARPQGAASIAPERPAPQAAVSARFPVPPQHRPRARPVAHHDAHAA